ncbi:hypothetical protein SNEBB_006674 [Seison nebaliae]|nr:hypothetical protein SNEBB_006674 [Seison nebaliae]
MTMEMKETNIMDIMKNMEDLDLELSENEDVESQSKKIDKELNHIENESIKDYINESKNVLQLHHQIVKCDEILQRMESMLTTFESNLSGISQEIQTLQGQSVKMNIRLKNRRAIKNELNQFVNELIIPKNLVCSIMEDDIDSNVDGNRKNNNILSQQFIESLHELHHKLLFVQQQQQLTNGGRACDEIEPLLNQLKIKALQRIKDHLVDKLQQLKKDQVNYELMKESLIKNRFIFAFLQTHQPILGENIRRIYVEVMDKLHANYFRLYATKLYRHSCMMFYENRNDLLGDIYQKDFRSIKNTAKNVFGSLFFNSTTEEAKDNQEVVSIYDIDDRHEILMNDYIDAPPLVPHAIVNKFSFDIAYRSLLFALLENYEREKCFLNDFFLLPSTDSTNVNDEVCGSIFESTFNALHQLTKEHLLTNTHHDVHLLYICVVLLNRFGKNLDLTLYSAFHKFIKKEWGIIWPKIDITMQLHSRSISNSQIHLSKQMNDNFHNTIHPFVKRFAHFISTIYSIGYFSITDGHDRMKVNLMTMNSEMENVLLLIASNHSDRMKQLVFLINNVNHIIKSISTHFPEDGTHLRNTNETLKLQIAMNDRGKYLEDCIIEWSSLLRPNINEYVNETLRNYIGPLIDFINIYSNRLNSFNEQSDLNENEKQTKVASIIVKEHEGELIGVIKHFNAEWRSALDNIHRSISEAFIDSVNSSNLLQLIVQTFIDHHRKMSQITSQTEIRQLLMGKYRSLSIISHHNLLVDAKKYKI